MGGVWSGLETVSLRCADDRRYGRQIIPNAKCAKFAASVSSDVTSSSSAHHTFSLNDSGPLQPPNSPVTDCSLAWLAGTDFRVATTPPPHTITIIKVSGSQNPATTAQRCQRAGRLVAQHQHWPNPAQLPTRGHHGVLHHTLAAHTCRHHYQDRTQIVSPWQPV